MFATLERIKIAALLGVLATGLTGGGAGAGVIRDDRDPQAYLNLAASPKYATVGRVDISRDQPGFIGSGTLIAPDWVLTAAHLMDDATSVNFHLDNQDHSSDRWFTDPKWDGDPLHAHDVALVHLSQPVSDVAPAILNRKKNEFGQTATFVGYGRTGIGSTGATSYDGLKRAGQNTIDGEPAKAPETYDSKLKSSSRIFTVDFDNPGRPEDNVIGSPTPLDLEYLISFGDSGGGVFIDTPAGTLLAGIISYGEAPNSADDSGYGDITGQTRVASYTGWIRKVIRKNSDASVRREMPQYPLLGSTNVRELYLPDASALLPDDTAYPAVSPSESSSLPEPASACVLIGLCCMLTHRRHRYMHIAYRPLGLFDQLHIESASRSRPAGSTFADPDAKSRRWERNIPKPTKN